MQKMSDKWNCSVTHVRNGGSTGGFFYLGGENFFKQNANEKFMQNTLNNISRKTTRAGRNQQKIITK